MDLPVLAAAYAYGLVNGHPYRDGNKRIGLLAVATFVDLNGYELDDAEVVTLFGALAAGSASENELVEWIREHAINER